MRTTTAAIAALPLLLALALTGCGSDDGGGPGVASAGGAKTPSAKPSLSRAEAGAKYAACLRKHGLDVPDPEPGKGFTMKFDGQSKATVDKAMQACREYSPRNNADPGMQKKSEERARKFAQCMREHGVDMPDPQPGQPGIRIDKKQGDDPDFPAAQRACQDIVGGLGGPPGGGE